LQFLKMASSSQRAKRKSATSAASSEKKENIAPTSDAVASDVKSVPQQLCDLFDLQKVKIDGRKNNPAAIRALLDFIAINARAKGMCGAALCKFTPWPPFNEDQKLGKKWLAEAGAKGDAFAQFWCILHGIGARRKNEKAAFALLQKAPDGDFDIAYLRGLCYEQELCGLKKEQYRAEYYFRTAAMEGKHPDAMYMLGVINEDCPTVEVQMDAVECYKQAAAWWHRNAMFSLSLLYRGPVWSSLGCCEEEANADDAEDPNQPGVMSEAQRWQQEGLSMSLTLSVDE
jgi:TPR repeat protein